MTPALLARAAFASLSQLRSRTLNPAEFEFTILKPPY